MMKSLQKALVDENPSREIIYMLHVGSVYSRPKFLEGIHDGQMRESQSSMQQLAVVFYIGRVEKRFDVVRANRLSGSCNHRTCAHANRPDLEQRFLGSLDFDVQKMNFRHREGKTTYPLSSSTRLWELVVVVFIGNCDQEVTPGVFQTCGHVATACRNLAPSCGVTPTSTEDN